jgi:hypothetical protein
VLSYILHSIRSFILIVLILKIIGHGNPDSNLESTCTVHKRVVFISCLMRN